MDPVISGVISGANPEDSPSTVAAATILAEAVQEATERVELLVETASELLGESLDHSSLHKLAQMSKEMGMEREETLQSDGHGDRDDEGSESHVSATHYVTAPSSPIIHISGLAIAEEIQMSPAPSLSRRSSRDGTPALSRKLRFTTISGERDGERQKRSRLEVEYGDMSSARSDPGTPNLSET
jgi:hypothetical protein